MDEIANTMINTVKWGVASSVFNSITMSIQSAYSYVQGLDSSLNDIRIVTGKSADEMSRFAVQANEAARNLSASTRDIAEAALIYYQQGDENAEAMYKAQVTTSAANVSGIDPDEMSDYLTAVWNGYQVANQAAKEGMGVYTEYVDKLAAVAATTASDLAEVATGMSKVASVANQVGVDFDSLNAQISTIVSVTRQAPETVGNALRTIYARIADLKIDGELGKVSGGLADLGIQVLDTSGELRNMDDILGDIAGHWNEWDTKTQTSAAQLLAGKYQYNSLVTLFNNWNGMYSEALDTSLNATGELAKQQDIYSQRITAHIQEMRTSWESVADSFFNEDFQETLKNFIDGFATFGDVTATLFDSLGGGLPLLQLLGSLLLQIGSRQIGTAISTFVSNFQASKDRVAQLNAELEITQSLAQSKGYEDTVIKGIVDRTAAMQQYYSVMSEGDINENKDLIAKIASYEQQKQAIEQNTQAAEEFISKVTGATNLNILGDNVDESVLNKFGKIQTVLENIYKWISRVSENFNTLSYDIEKTENGIEIFNGIKKSAEDLLNTNALNEEQFRRINELVQQLNSYGNKGVIENSGQLPANPGEIEKLNNIVNDLILLIKQYGKEAVDSATIAGSAIDKNVEEYNKAKNGAEAYSQQLEANKARISQAFDTTQIVKFVGGLGQIAFGLEQITNLGDIWSDKDSTTGEKILQTFVSLSFVIPSLISGLKEFSSFREEFFKSFERKTQTDISTTQDSLKQVANEKELQSEKLKKELKKQQVLLDQKDTLELQKQSLVNDLNFKKKQREQAQQQLDIAKQAEIEAVQEYQTAIDDLNRGMISYEDFTKKASTAQNKFNKATQDSQIAQELLEQTQKEVYTTERNLSVTENQLNNAKGAYANQTRIVAQEEKINNDIKEQEIVLNETLSSQQQRLSDLQSTNIGVITKLKQSWAALGTTAKAGIAGIAAAAAILIAMKVYDALTISSKEAVEQTNNLKDSYEEVSSKVEELNSSLEQTKERIEELEKKDSLTFIEQQELDKLKETQSLLESQKKLQEDLAKTAAEAYADSAGFSVQKQFGQNTVGTIG